MKAQKYLDILREIKDVAFATVDENGKPQVRIIDVMIVENEKLYFCNTAIVFCGFPNVGSFIKFLLFYIPCSIHLNSHRIYFYLSKP